MKKIKVAHIITRMIVGGAQENTLYTCRELSKDPAYSVTLITGPSLGPEGDLLETAGNVNFRILHLPLLRRAINPFYDLIALMKIVSICRREKFDLVHTHSSKAGILGRWGAWMAGVPIRLHTVHGWGFHQHQSAWIRRLYIFLERQTAKITDKLITVSKENTQKGCEHKIGKPKQYQTIYSGISLERFKPKNKDEIDQLKKKVRIPENKTVLGSVGRFVQQKNPFFILECAENLIQKNKNVYFVMIGDGPLKKNFIQKLKTKQLDDYFLLPGLQTDIENWIQCLDLLLLPSKWEGLPRALLQAMSEKKCVLASDTDGIREVVENNKNGLLIKDFDSELWTQAITEVIENREKYHSICENAQKTVTSNFSDVKMVQDIKNLMNKLTGLKS